MARYVEMYAGLASQLPLSEEDRDKIMQAFFDLTLYAIDREKRLIDAHTLLTQETHELTQSYVRVMDVAKKHDPTILAREEPHLRKCLRDLRKLRQLHNQYEAESIPKKKRTNAKAKKTKTSN